MHGRPSLSKAFAASMRLSSLSASSTVRVTGTRSPKSRRRESTLAGWCRLAAPSRRLSVKDQYSCRRRVGDGHRQIGRHGRERCREEALRRSRSPPCGKRERTERNRGTLQFTKGDLECRGWFFSRRPREATASLHERALSGIARASLRAFWRYAALLLTFTH